MAKYFRGDVVWVYYPFQDDPAESKRRPAVLIEDPSDDFFVVKCTKTDKSKYGPCILIKKGTEEFMQMGLSQTTYICVTEEITLNKVFIDGYIGSCPDNIMDEIDALRDSSTEKDETG